MNWANSRYFMGHLRTPLSIQRSIMFLARHTLTKNILLHGLRVGQSEEMRLRFYLQRHTICLKNLREETHLFTMLSTGFALAAL